VSLLEFNSEKFDQPCRLEILARDIFDKAQAIEILDQPFILTQETRHDLPPLSTETRIRLENYGVPASVLDSIGSEAEANIYESANLEYEVINGKAALIRTDIDYNQKDIFGNTNLERMQEGRAPLDANGKPIELHHIGQKSDSPLAELSSAEHRSNGNDNILHNKLKESEIDRNDFNQERKEHWMARAELVENQQ
jgi:hypothetical protein